MVSLQNKSVYDHFSDFMHIPSFQHQKVSYTLVDIIMMKVQMTSLLNTKTLNGADSETLPADDMLIDQSRWAQRFIFLEDSTYRKKYFFIYPS